MATPPGLATAEYLEKAVSVVATADKRVLMPSELPHIAK
jgi:hypothetical protein